MKDFIFIPPMRMRKHSKIALPGSKSISNRTLLLAALGEGTTAVHALLDSDDTRRMLEALVLLGVKIDKQPKFLTVHGCAGKFPVPQAELFLGNAGTAFRPLTAVLALLGGDYTLTGVARMHERPIGDLVDALRQAGAQITYLGQEGFPPLKIGAYADGGTRVLTVRGNVSSQFLTALLLALPLTGQAWQVQVVGELISKPYIEMTLKLMAQFGVVVENEDFHTFRLPEGAAYRNPPALYVEGDASSASYFLAAAVLGAKTVRVTGIGKNSIQGDVAFAQALEGIGAQVRYGDDFVEVSRASKNPVQAFDIDANAIPDAAMTLAVVALAAEGTSSIRNIASWRVKETDRLAAMSTELRKLGAEVEEGADFIRITPPAKLTPNVRIDTYDDHRMAMCFSLVSLLDTPVIINEPECVSKTFPDYFQVFATIFE